MATFEVYGGRQLKGELHPQGAKNEALQIICATLLTPEKVTVRNIPNIRDVIKLIELLQCMGVEVEHPEPSVCTFKATNVNVEYLTTEDFKNKVSALIEAVIADRVSKHKAKLDEKFELAKVELVQSTLTESEELKEGLVDKIDGYLDYVVEQWMENNELALERGIRGELFESFMTGMKNLFEEHHVNVSDEQLDVIEEMKSELSALSSRLDEMTEQNVELMQVIKEVERQSQIAEAAEGLSDLDVEKFKILAEELVFEDGESFARKLDVVRENFFSKTESKKLNEGVLDTNTQIFTEEVDVKTNSVMDTYARILSRNN